MQTNTMRNASSNVSPDTTLLTLQEEAITRSALPPLKTYWMPLDEFKEQWAAFGSRFPDFPFALTATGHAFFALSHERRASSHFTQVARERARLSLPAYWRRYEVTWKQAERDLHESCYHWSRAAFCLDQLLARPLTAQECEAIRTHARAARWQQERLWALLDEVRRDIDTWRAPQAGEEAPQQEVTR